jgi:hypothetical protein
MNFDTVKTKLMKTDEITVLELLDISSEELVEAFPERIRQRLAYISKELEMAIEDEYEVKELDFDD